MPGDSTEAPTGFRQRSRSESGLNSDRLDAVERAVGVIRTWMADIKRVTRPEVVLTLDDTDRHKSDYRTGKGIRSSDKGWSSPGAWCTKSGRDSSRGWVKAVT